MDMRMPLCVVPIPDFIKFSKETGARVKSTSISTPMERRFMTSQSSRRDGADDMATDEMELGDKPAQEIDLQTEPMEHIETDICNIPESSKIKQEPDFHINVDVAKFIEYSKYSGTVANIIDIKTEVIGSDDYDSGNMNNTHGHTHSADIIGHHVPINNVTVIKPEPEDETNLTNEFVIEIDTCKDEYYQKCGYPTNCVSVNLQNTEHHCGRNLSAIDLEPCSVGLTDIRRTYPDIITQRAVHIHEPGPTGVIDGPLGASVTDLPRQTKSIKTNKAHVCKVCGAAFRDKWALNSHTLIHTGEKPHACPVCGVGFTQKHHMKTHIRTHTGVKPHTCSVCEVGFIDRSSLTRHMRTHTGEKPYKCSVCGVGFTQKGTLKTHMRIHTGEKSVMCSVCKSTFATNYGLISHTRIHTGEKPYKCSVCGFEFTWKCNLKIHMRIHTGEKPHTCSVCNGSFTQKDNLTSHMRSHSGGKPYKCT